MVDLPSGGCCTVHEPSPRSLSPFLCRVRVRAGSERTHEAAGPLFGPVGASTSRARGRSSYESEQRMDLYPLAYVIPQLALSVKSPGVRCKLRRIDAEPSDIPGGRRWN